MSIFVRRVVDLKINKSYTQIDGFPIKKAKKVYDKNGKHVATVSEEHIYDHRGEKIASWE